MPLLFVSIQPVLDRKIPLDTEKPRTRKARRGAFTGHEKSGGLLAVMTAHLEQFHICFHDAANKAIR